MEKRRRPGDLPEDVLLLVLSRIEDGREQVRISGVSPTWRRLCKQLPSLVLDFRRRRDAATALVANTLPHRHRLHSLAYRDSGMDFGNAFISLALEGYWRREFSNALTSVFQKGFQLPYLQSLKLDHTLFEAGEAQALVDACPSLEVCEMACSIISDVDEGSSELVFKTPGLKRLQLHLKEGLSSIRLQGCNELTSLEICYRDDDERVKLCVDGFNMQLQHCVLEGVVVEDSNVLDSWLNSPMLETLTLWPGEQVPSSQLIIRMQNVVRLHLGECADAVVLDGTYNLAELKLGWVDSLQIHQTVSKLTTVRLEETSWEVVTSLLHSDAQIRELELELEDVEELSEQRIVEVLDSLHCLEELKLFWPECDVIFKEFQHPRFLIERIYCGAVTFKIKGNTS